MGGVAVVAVRCAGAGTGGSGGWGAGSASSGGCGSGHHWWEAHGLSHVGLRMIVNSDHQIPIIKSLFS